MKTILKFKKGKLYAPDSMEYLPKETNKYFSQDGLEEWNHPDYEYGTCKCIQSFQITITIKELP